MQNIWFWSGLFPTSWWRRQMETWNERMGFEFARQASNQRTIHILERLNNSKQKSRGFKARDLVLYNIIYICIMNYWNEIYLSWKLPYMHIDLLSYSPPWGVSILRQIFWITIWQCRNVKWTFSMWNMIKPISLGTHKGNVRTFLGLYKISHKMKAQFCHALCFVLRVHI